MHNPQTPTRTHVRRKVRPLPPAVRGVATANKSATREPAAQGFINANQVYVWNEGAIYQAYAAPGNVTDIALQPGEALIAVASGDTVRWVIGDTTSGGGAEKRTHILVKPFASGLATNLESRSGDSLLRQNAIDTVNPCRSMQGNRPTAALAYWAKSLATVAS